MIEFLLFIIILIYAYESWKNIKNYPQYLRKCLEEFNGVVPHNIANHSDNPINGEISSLDDLKATDNREKAHYLILLRLEETRKQIDEILNNLVESNMISSTNFEIFKDNNARTNFLNRYSNEIPNEYNSIINNISLVDFTTDEFRFLLRLMNSKEILTDKGYSFLVNSNILRQLQLFKGLKQMRLIDGKLVVTEEEESMNNIDLKDVLDTPGIYATSYLSLPNKNNKTFNNKQTDKYSKYREDLPKYWKCQSGNINIARDGNNVIEEDGYLSCQTIIPKSQFTYYSNYYSS